MTGGEIATGEPTLGNPAADGMVLSSTAAGVRSWVEQSAGDTLPVGAIMPFASSNAPAGWLVCNGTAISRSTYADLFGVIGTVYGAGDGSTTFNLPDLRGEFVRGWDNGRGVDSGRTLGSAQEDELKSHNHDVYNSSGGSAYWGSQFSFAQINGTGQGDELRVDNAVDVYGGSETRPRNVALLYCIKAFSSATEPVGVDCAALITDLQNDVSAHAQNASNPHGVSVEQVGMPCYKRQYLTSNNATNPSQFANALGFGRVFTYKGEIAFGASGGGSVMYSINVHVASNMTVNFPCFHVDDNWYAYADGVHVGTPWAATAGDHVVQIVHNNSGGSNFSFLLGEWIDGTNVQYIGTPD